MPPRQNDLGMNSELNVDWATRYWIKNGMPKEKIMLGLATYSRCFTLGSSSTEFGAPAYGGCEAGPVTFLVS
jgi:GH18 family chitinase